MIHSIKIAFINQNMPVGLLYNIRPCLVILAQVLSWLEHLAMIEMCSSTSSVYSNIMWKWCKLVHMQTSTIVHSSQTSNGAIFSRTWTKVVYISGSELTADAASHGLTLELRHPRFWYFTKLWNRVWKVQTLIQSHQSRSLQKGYKTADSLLVTWWIHKSRAIFCIQKAVCIMIFIKKNNLQKSK